MRYSDDIIEEVISRNNIVDVIGEQVRLRRSGSNYTGLCPFHNEKTPSFSVSESKQMYYCFGCHAGGNVITFMMTYHNYTFPEALKALADRAGIALPEEQLSEEQRAASDHRKAMFSAMKAAAGFYYYNLKRETGAAGLRYLRGRGLTDETIRHFGLGYSDKFGDSLYRYLKSKEYSDKVLADTGLFKFDEKQGVSDRFWNRVMFPILDERARVIGFGGRVMGDGKPKYLNSPEGVLFNKRKHLFALNYARATREKNLILCEGYMDVISMHQAGFTNAVASLGTALTPEQCTLMRRFTGEVLLIYDSDNAGINASLRAIPLLKEAGLAAKVVSLAPYKDPDEFLKGKGPEALKERLLAADSSFLFEITQLSANYRRNEPAEWTAFQHETASKLSAIEDELERMNYLDAVCARFGFPAEAMKRLVAKKAAVGTPAEHYTPKRKGGDYHAEMRDDSALTSQKLMLGYLAGYPEAVSETRDLVKEDDFTNPLCRRIAHILYRQLEEGKVSEASLIAEFTDPEEESFAAGVFHTDIPVSSSSELDRAFTDTVLAVMKSGLSLWQTKANEGDMDALNRYLVKKQTIEKVAAGKPLHLSYREKSQ